MTPHPQEPDASDAELPGGGNAVQVSAEDATHLRALVAAMPCRVLLLAPDAPRFTMRAASDAYLAATLITREEALGRPLFEVFSDANPANVARSGVANLRASLETVLRTREPHRMPVQRYDLRRPDGSWEERYWAPLNIPVLGPDGDVRYLLHQVDDVTARTRAEAALEESESRRLLAVEAAGIADWTYDVAAATLHCSPLASAMHRVGPGEPVSIALHDRLIHPDDRAVVLARRAAALDPAGDGCYRVEFRFRYDGGEVRWFESVGRAVFEDTPEGPRATQLVGAMLDVTARHEAAAERERLLAQREAAHAAADLERRRLLAVLEQLPIGVHVADAPSGKLVLDNAAVRAIYGEAPRSQRVADYGADYAGYYPAGHPRAGERLTHDAWPLARAIATGAPVAEEHVEVRRADGTRRLVSVSAAPVRDADGRVVEAVATNVDVTERERLLADAEAARREAEEANRAKSEFLAVMSHELRTPLNAIGGYAQLMQMEIRGPITAEQRDDLRRLQASQRHLLGLINEVLDYAKVETGAVHYDLAEIRVHEALSAAEALVAPQAQAKGLVLEVPPAEPALVVRADAEKLRQVLVNLLSNAVKFTERGGRIELRAEALDGRVRVSVSDTGVGIAPEQLDRVFEPFVQVSAELTRTAEGTGLGLAISRDLARGMGGDLTVESAPGEGSTFTLTLPAA